MTWIDSLIDKAGDSVVVDVSHLNMGIEKIEVVPLTASEYNVLKRHPELSGLQEDDKVEKLGLLMIAEMMNKADKDITWAKLQRLPLQTLANLSQAITKAIGNESVGVLGE